MPTPSCLALMPRDPIEFVELKLDNFNDNFGYFKPPDSVSGPGSGSGSEPITIIIEPYKSWSGWFNHQSNDSPLIRLNFSLQSPHHSFFSSSSHHFPSSNHHPSQYQLAFFARKNDPPTLTSHHMFEVISLRNQLNEVRINFDLWIKLNLIQTFIQLEIRVWIVEILWPRSLVHFISKWQWWTRPVGVECQYSQWVTNLLNHN